MVAIGRQKARKQVQLAHRPYDTQKGAMITSFLTAPYDATLMRMPTVDMPQTAIIRLRDQMSVNHISAQILDYDVGDMVYSLYGQPGRMLDYGPVIPAGVGYYRCYFQPPGAFVLPNALADPLYWTLYPLPKTGPPNFSLSKAEDWPLAKVEHTPTNGFNQMYTGQRQKAIGMYEEKNYIFLNHYEEIRVVENLGTTTFNGDATFQVYYYQQENVVPVSYEVIIPLVNGVIPVGSVLVNPLNEDRPAGYYALRFMGFNSTSGATSSGYFIGVAVYLTSAQPIRIQRYAPELDGDRSIGAVVRRTAASLLITNTSALNFRQGTVIGARLAGADETTTTKARLDVAAQRYVGDGANGCYTYLSFSGSDEQFHTAVDRELGGISFSLASPEYVHVVRVSNPSVATAPNSYAVSVDCVLEFMTDSQRYSKEVPMLLHDELVEARRIANATPFFYENPLHLADIGKYVLKAWGFLRKNAVPISNAISAVAPQYGPAARYIARAIGT